MPNRCATLPQCFHDHCRSTSRARTAPSTARGTGPSPPGAILCGLRGYKAISEWADGTGPEGTGGAFGCRHENGHYPRSERIRHSRLLVRIEPGALDRALARPGTRRGVAQDQGLAMDGKTMKNALDEAGQQTHIMSVVGHDSTTLSTPKKSR